MTKLDVKFETWWNGLEPREAMEQITKSLDLVGSPRLTEVVSALVKQLVRTGFTCAHFEGRIEQIDKMIAERKRGMEAHSCG